MYDFQYERFNTIYDFEKAVNSREVNKGFDVDDGSYKKNYDFCMTRTYEEADGLLRKGWNEKVDVMVDELKKFSRTVDSRNVRQIKSVAGYAPCVPNAIKGVPKSMFSRADGKKKTKTVHLILNNVACAGVSGDDLMKCGMTVLKLAMVLDKLRVRTKIDLVPFVGCKDNSVYGCSVSLKDYRQPFNLSKMAYPTAHVSFFRRHGFRWLETMKGFKNRGFIFGYGRPLGNVANEEIKSAYYKFAGFTKEGVVYIDYNDCKNADFDYKVLAERKGIKLA